MKLLRGAALSGCALVAGAGCRTVTAPVAAPAPTAMSSAVHTDIAGLGKVIALPLRPLAATWRQTQIGDGNFGSSDYQLFAVLQFAPKDADKIEALARKRGAAQGANEVEFLNWFPATLRKVAVRGAGGGLILRGQKWMPDDFARMSFINGSVMRVGKTNFFVLSLYTT